MAGALLLLAGCLPSSCGRTGSSAISPADSVSRRVARGVPLDTLQRAWRASASGALPLRLPRTALFLSLEGAAPGTLAVSDAERGAVLFFSENGQRVEAVEDEAFAAPYLIGQRGDTLVVLSPRERRVHFLIGERVARTATLGLPPVEEAPLLWAVASRKGLFAKTIDADGQARITRHVWGDGRAVTRRTLGGPRWHHAGPLRLWQGALANFSGYRPVAHRLPLSLSGRMDTVRLEGFDSPMLARTRRYAEGDARQPPLLMPDVAAAGNGDSALLFALNLRAGRLRIDAFGPDGRLAARRVAPGEARSQDVYPRALAARRHADGSYALAVALTAPRPAVALYRWHPGSGAGSGNALLPAAD